MLEIFISKIYPVDVIKSDTSGYDRECIKEKVTTTNSILIINTYINLMDLQLYYFDKVLIFDETYSLNPNVIYLYKKSDITRKVLKNYILDRNISIFNIIFNRI